MPSAASGTGSFRASRGTWQHAHSAEAIMFSNRFGRLDVPGVCLGVPLPEAQLLGSIQGLQGFPACKSSMQLPFQPKNPSADLNGQACSPFELMLHSTGTAADCMQEQVPA